MVAALKVKNRLLGFFNRQTELSEKEKSALRAHRESLVLQEALLTTRIRDLEGAYSTAIGSGVMLSEKSCVNLWKARHMRRELRTVIGTFDRLLGSDRSVESV